MVKTVNVLSLSGGKDSTAMWLYVSKELGLEVYPVFADTGNEHDLTYQYVDYLERELGTIHRVKADFTSQIKRKRKYVETKWREKGVPENIVQSALSVLEPTGNPFLDLCIVKGRFPSRMAQFCTQFLKVFPVQQQVYFPLMEQGNHVVSCVGVRAAESSVRAKYSMREETPEGWQLYRPILEWDVKQVFEIHKKHGIEPNPLYKLGMGRVGCMPCINCAKDELFEISRRFPAVIERIRQWEDIVASASKRGSATFFAPVNGEWFRIDTWTEWSKTSYGGKQYDLIKAIEFEDVPVCSSQYGLCE
ncbi:phosphoadenosine phosphosulfate reductase family protein [Brevibacillus sp. FIR094]|uniref:phosphoadenosine phosphosulfate reductase domain-containing protein n=1 Tax=Brevibacillus sp. FIR094 TaxID=3134809 RepID=UPI003D23AD7F